VAPAGFLLSVARPISRRSRSLRHSMTCARDSSHFPTSEDAIQAVTGLRMLANDRLLAVLRSGAIVEIGLANGGVRAIPVAKPAILDTSLEPRGRRACFFMRQWTGDGAAMRRGGDPLSVAGPREVSSSSSSPREVAYASTCPRCRRR
jgi:hypothetical protein